jgi:hypothetical protein
VTDLIDSVKFYGDEDGWHVVLEGDFGKHDFRCDPEDFKQGLRPYDDHMLEGEVVRREFEAAGRVSWDAYKLAQSRMDPEWAEELRVATDLARKSAREGAMVDPGDVSDAA